MPLRWSLAVIVLLLCSVGPMNAWAQAPNEEVLPLEVAIDEALRNNPEVRIADNEVAIAEREASLGGAGFLPELSLQARYNETISNTNQQFRGQEAEDITGARSTNAGADAELSWRVFEGLGRFATLDRLRAERDAEQQRARSTRQQLVTDVALAYYSVVREQRQRIVLEEAVELSDERLRIAEVRNEVGRASDLEVRQARVDRNADQAELLRQRATLQAAKSDLNRLLGRPTTDTDFAVEEAIEVDDTLTRDQLRERAEQTNPVLQQAQAARDAAEHEARAVQATRWPTLDARLGYGVDRVESESGFVAQSTSYDATYGLSLQLPLFTGFERRRQRQNAAVRVRNAELAVDDVQTELTTTLASAYTEYENRLELVELETENVALARENVEVALQQFEVGDISSIELREVQEQLVRAESQLVRARFDAKQAELTLQELSGGVQAGM